MRTNAQAATHHGQYVFGHSETESLRLVLQAEMLRPMTEALLIRAGVGPDARVLDIGCGAGDVALIAGELVGPFGSVLGIDRNAELLELADRRAVEAGLPQVRFAAVALEAFADRVPFDAVVGRYVLIHQPDPVAFLQRAARLVRPGGVLAFHEVDISASFGSRPPVWRWDAAGYLLAAGLREALPHYDAAARFVEHFAVAGLPTPQVWREVPVGGGPDSPLYPWLVETLRGVWPRLVAMGLAAGDGPAEALETNLREAVAAAHSQIDGPPQVCAWARI